MATKAKGEPFSVRFSAATDRAIAAEAKRLNRSKSSIVEALAEEAMRIRRFPGIAFRGEDSRRRPWVIGTGLDVWEIVEIAADDADVLALAAEDRRILVTRNSREFEPLTREWAEAGRSHAGVILVWSFRSNQFAGIVSAVERSFALYPRAAQWRNLVVSV